MDYIEQMLGLPIQVLSVLASGYLSYRLAYTGRDASHKSVDVVFIAFVFAFIAQLSGGVAVALLWPISHSILATPVVAALTGMACALVASALWRRWGMSWLFKFLRNTGISHSDRHTSAWQSVIS